MGIFNKEPDNWRLLTLRVHTPKGEAEKNLPIIKTSIMRFCKGTSELESDHTILFKIKCRNDKVMQKVIKRAKDFDNLIHGLFGKFAQKAVGGANKEKLRHMLEDETKMEVVGYEHIDKQVD
jgi:hypothetical protein